MARRERLAAALLPLAPAALAALQLSGLIFFLNPERPFSWSYLLRGAAYYTLLFAPLSLGVHFAVARWRRVEIARLVPWSLTVVAALAALGDGVHASFYAFLLSPSINAQLVKSALWLALAAVLLFYTALLHTLGHSRYGVRSRALIALVTVGSVYAMFERRTSYRAPRLETPKLAVAADSAPLRLVVVALPTATLDAVLPLARQAKLPFFAETIERGATARLATPTPPRPVSLEATWATGKQPFRHLIVADRTWSSPLFGSTPRLALLPIAPAFGGWGLAGGHPAPLDSRDLRAVPVWTILARGGVATRAFGFPAWLPDVRMIPPAGAGGSLSPVARELETLEAGVDLDGDLERLAALRFTSAESGAQFAELPGLARVAFANYGGFDASAFEGRRSAATQRAARLYERYLAAIDAELGRVWSELSPPRLLVVSSAYGISAPRGLPRLARILLSGERELRGTLEGAPDGLLLARGEGIRAGVQIADGRTVDVVPTLLYASGFPIARDLDGRVLAEAFEPAVLQRRALSFVPSYDGWLQP